MRTARDIMTRRRVRAPSDTLVDVARKMRDFARGSLPICGSDNKLQGMITDATRDDLSRRGDPNHHGSGVRRREAITIGAALTRSRSPPPYHGAPACRRRLPVIDGQDLVGSSARPMWPSTSSSHEIWYLLEAIRQRAAN